jgi:DNA-binding CsgD family transcriptional regulator
VRPGSNPLLDDRTLVTLQRLADGATATELGHEWGTTPDTLYHRLETVRKKLGARTTIHAVAIALRERYID